MDFTEKGIRNLPENKPRLIRNMREDEKPREKAIKQGIKSLSDAELMAIIFSTGIRGKSVIELSQDILDDNDGHLSRIAHKSIKEFVGTYKGIGPAKALTLLAALELGMRTSADARLDKRESITSSDKAYEIMAHRFSNLDHEEFWILLLSQSLRVIKDVRIGVGGLNATVVDVKIIIREALDARASAMIVCHNHPSGNLVPSPQDDALTKKIFQAAKLFDLRMADHLIISDNGYYSYQEKGRLNF